MSRPCPTPSKTGYPTKQYAIRGAHWQVMNENRDGRIQKALYVYRCTCGKWHTTKMPRIPGGPSNELAVDVPEELQRWAFPVDAMSPTGATVAEPRSNEEQS